MLGYGAAEKFLRTKDATERDRIHVMAVAARDVQRQHDLERATQTANKVGEMLGV